MPSVIHPPAFRLCKIGAAALARLAATASTMPSNFRHRVRLGLALSLLSLHLGACATGAELLRLQRDRLVEIEKAAVRVDSYAGAGHFEPARYDFYLFLNGQSLNQVLGAFDGFTFETDLSGRPVVFTLGSVRTAFRPGYPDMTVVASARDVRTGIEAKLDMDARWLVESDQVAPDKLFLRMVATRVAPDLTWNGWSVSRWRFARRLMQLQVSRLTEKVPRVEIPIERDFSIGNDAGFIDLRRIPTGDGSMDGRVTYPSTKVSGAIRICQVVFLRNGIHVFANAQGISSGEYQCALQAF